MRSKIVKQILHNGTSYGIRTVEISNWNGYIYIIPKSILKRASQLIEIHTPGTYLLINENEEAYVGKSGKIYSRLLQHYKEKDFWDYAVILGSPTFSSTEVEYLEYILYSRLLENQSASLMNITPPAKPAISHHQIDVLDEYLDYAALALLSAGIDIINPNLKEIQDTFKKGDSLYCTGENYSAQGSQGEGIFIVKEGSTIKKQTGDSTPSSVEKERSVAIANGIPTANAEGIVISSDFVFTSPSPAAAFVKGCSSNGQKEWKTENGISLKDIEL